MTTVTKHDRKEEGERDDCVECRIDFLVVGYTVRVYDRLETMSEPEECKGEYDDGNGDDDIDDDDYMMMMMMYRLPLHSRLEAVRKADWKGE